MFFAVVSLPVDQDALLAPVPFSRIVFEDQADRRYTREPFDCFDDVFAAGRFPFSALLPAQAAPIMFRPLYDAPRGQAPGIADDVLVQPDSHYLTF